MANTNQFLVPRSRYSTLSYPRVACFSLVTIRGCSVLNKGQDLRLGCHILPFKVCAGHNFLKTKYRNIKILILGWWLKPRYLKLKPKEYMVSTHLVVWNWANCDSIFVDRMISIFSLVQFPYCWWLLYPLKPLEEALPDKISSNLL